MATFSRAREPTKVKVKSPYHLPCLTNLRLTVYSLLPPAPLLSINAPFYGSLKLLKATRKRKKSTEGFEVTPGNANRTRDLPYRRPRTKQLR